MVAIGYWVRREAGPGDEEGKWHLVESVISLACITRCGRRLEPEVDGYRLEVVASKPAGIAVCDAGCDSGAV